VSPLPTILNTNPSVSHATDKSSKASALLDSVVDSIQSPLNPVVTIPENEMIAPPMSQEISPNSRRNRDLAQILFGEQGQDHKPPSAKLPLSQSMPSPSVVVDPYSTETAGNSSTPESNNSFSEHTDVPMRSPYRSTTSSVRTPQTPIDQADLTKEVQRKADAAMLALRRTPSQPKSERGGVSGSISRRRVSPGQISNPRLVSASTSVDTIPLSPPLTSGNAQVTSKISQRIRRLRGTLRAKPPTPQGDEVTPYPTEAQTPPSSQTAYYDPASLRVPGEPTVASATEVGRFKVPVPSPPASAGPGLRGFMARFRKSRTVDSHPEPEHLRSPPTLPTSPLVSPSMQQERTLPLSTQSFTPTLAASQNPTSPQYPYSPLMRPENVTTPPPPPPNTAGTNGVDDVALKQLFDAASNLGLDQEALNDLLARSSSPRSTGWTMLTRDNSFTANTIPEVVDENVPERIRSTAPSDGRLGTDALDPPENAAVRKLSIRKGGADHLRRPRNVQDDGTAFNAIVRRTIIFPSESKSSTIDLNVLMRKNSQSQSTRHRRSPSVASISSRSVHDRVPTPPPPRSPTKRRFSADNSPPVPQLPFSFASHGESLLQPQSAPAGPIEKSPSAHDSL
jgi:serine/arginine repetitive matrix protein 2